MASGMLKIWIKIEILFMYPQTKVWGSFNTISISDSLKERLLQYLLDCQSFNKKYYCKNKDIMLKFVVQYNRRAKLSLFF